MDSLVRKIDSTSRSNIYCLDPHVTNTCVNEDAIVESDDSIEKIRYIWMKSYQNPEIRKKITPILQKEFESIVQEDIASNKDSLSEKPIWEEIIELMENCQDDESESIPDDISENIDALVYGREYL
jgi:hypothetical protein